MKVKFIFVGEGSIMKLFILIIVFLVLTLSLIAIFPMVELNL